MRGLAVMIALSPLTLPLASCSSFGSADESPVAPGDAAAAPAGDAATDAGSGCGDTTSDPANCGACGRSCLGRACRSGLCEVEPLAGGLTNARAITIGPSKVFFAFGANNQILTVPLGGGTVAPVHATGESVRALAVSGEDVFWIGQHSVGVVPAGGEAKALAIGGGRSLVFSGGRLFTTGGTTNEVLSFDPALAGKIVHGAAGAASAVAVDDAHVYWADPKAGIVRSTTTGNESIPFAPNEAATTVAVDANEVFWTTAGEIRKAAKSAAIPTAAAERATLATGLAQPQAILQDGPFVYWVEVGSGVIRRVPKAGGEITLIASITVPPVFEYTQLLAATETHLYFVSPADKTLSRVAK